MDTKQLFLVVLVILVAPIHSSAQQSEGENGCHEGCVSGCYGPGQDECCHEQCLSGCTDGADTGCTECLNVNLNGACRENCGSPFMYNDVTFELEPNPDFLFQYGRECVERCPKFVSTELERCVDQCRPGYRKEGDQCVKCGGACPREGATNPLIRDQCDGVKPYPWGVINRKNRPTGNVTCTQVLIGSPGSTLQLKFRDIDVHNAIDEKLVISADGFKQCFDRDSYASSLTLRASVAVVQHRTFASGHGFVLEYDFTAGSEEPTWGCDVMLTSSQGAFSSPEYPGKYKAREQCVYQIVVDPGYRVAITFQRFYMQGDEPACLADKLEMTEPILGTTVTHCGRKRPPFTITSQTNYVVLKFTSDEQKNFKGFTATYEAVEATEGVEEP
ncbi:blastula protease 10-like [Asterias amurensis]|uniref:blastula protease 10-like n=1 Tax=Asterias amurensis TaxID=7602 RepID=UPI003AB1230B